MPSRKCSALVESLTPNQGLASADGIVTRRLGELSVSGCLRLRAHRVAFSPVGLPCERPGSKATLRNNVSTLVGYRSLRSARVERVILNFKQLATLLETDRGPHSSDHAGNGRRQAGLLDPQPILKSGRTGWYLRVLQGGTVRAPADTNLLERPHPLWTVARATRVVHFEKDASLRADLAHLEGLSPAWKDALSRK